jgi:type II secretory pathway pseudopilin PulG
MNWTLIRFIIICAVGVLAILALPLAPRIMHSTPANTRALRATQAWMTASALVQVLNGAISDASDLGWLHIDHAILSQINAALSIACVVAIFVGVWCLPRKPSESETASTRSNDRAAEQ